MALNTEQISRIQNRSPGWQDDWTSLLQDLLPLLDQKTRAFRGWPGDEDREDFVSETLQHYQVRVNAGTLLSAWSAEKGDVLSFLTGRKLRKRALSFLANCNRRRQRFVLLEDHSSNDPDDRPAMELEAPKARTLALRSVERLRNAVLQRLEKIELAIGSGGVTRDLEQAALQLYPLLDWTQPQNKPLHDHLRETLSTSLGKSTRDVCGLLEALHSERQGRFAEQVSAESEKVLNSVKPLTAEIYRARLDELEFERSFMPLDSAALQKLLGVSASNAEKLRSRYRANLPNVLKLKEDWLTHFDSFRSTGLVDEH